MNFLARLVAHIRLRSIASRIERNEEFLTRYLKRPHGKGWRQTMTERRLTVRATEEYSNELRAKRHALVQRYGVSPLSRDARFRS